MATFWATITKNQYEDLLEGHLGGHVKIEHCAGRAEARTKMHAALGSEWSFLYDREEDMHEYDREFCAITIH